ncbi:MAG: serine--tRNA ligase [Acetivibrionales bacterium]|jgi:seryl-tRNA synthetase|nr:serine--tRNA ligase [Clostridiaceae bacterium]
MLDIQKIRNNPEEVKEALKKRLVDVDFTELLEWDKKRRNLISESEELKAKKNKVSADIPRLIKNGQNVDDLKVEMKEIADRIKVMDDELRAVEADIKSFLSGLPNIPAEDVVAGGKENNQVLRTFGQKPEFDFEPKHHVDIVTDLGLIDYERGVKLGGNGFWVYTGDGAVLEWALLNYFVEEHLKDGYQFMLPPHILNYQSGYTAGQFPKFAEDVFKIETGEVSDRMQFILPTAETALINFHRDEILNEDEMPKKYFAYTPCYRKEAGSHGADERGMIRGHQFNKIEMFQYTLPEQSEAAFEELVNKAERLVQGLGLHHQVTKLAAQDCSASMGKTYDIEIWIPSMNSYKEVSSCSNAYDYQARRGNIRVRRKDSKKIELAHTLNASGLATSRVLPAIVEQYQQKDGSVIIPEVLRKWMGGRDRLLPKR